MFESLFQSVYNNLIAGNAWLTILQGLWVTLQITFLGVLTGTVTGAVFCAMGRSPYRVLRGISVAVVSFFRGTPATLLLMTMYYVVFANSRVDARIVAVCAFALNGGAHISQVMHSALSSLDQRQLEAARMLGFSRSQAFFAITLPQGWQVAKPVYQNAIVNLLQWTSVVGYVTITDLTRAVNSMGNRTGDPFFALFLGMLLYLGLSYAVHGLFSIGKRGPRDD